MPQIAVAFDIDCSGILNVTAKDKATGEEQSSRVEGSGGLDAAGEPAEDRDERVIDAEYEVKDWK